MSDQEERQHFRDVLVETNTLLKAHIDNSKLYQDAVSKRIDKHETSDEIHFARLYGSVGKLRWYVAMGMGGLAAFEMAIKFFQK